MCSQRSGWEAYIDNLKSVVGDDKYRSYGIFFKNGAVGCCETRNYVKPPPDEVQGLIAALQCPENLYTHGITFENKRYKLVKIDSDEYILLAKVSDVEKEFAYVKIFDDMFIWACVLEEPDCKNKCMSTVTQQSQHLHALYHPEQQQK